MKSMREKCSGPNLAALAIAALLVLAGTIALADAPSGAIFTTLPDGSEVNYNIYPSKDLVYLDGGPGPGAPQGAAGLDDGRYVFQVTDPSGRVLLSTDAARCRQFNVTGGIITSVVDTDCEHVTGTDVDHGAVTVQLLPYDDTPNNGGVYKAWAVRVEDFLLGCQALGFPGSTGLNQINCGRAPGNLHGFFPSDSKTDNFKVGGLPAEIDTRFFFDLNGNGRRDSGEDWIDGMQIKWMDPLLASNIKSSYENLGLDIHHEAHVEAVEKGVHQIIIADQEGCAVGAVYVDGVRTAIDGPQIVQVQIRENMKKDTIYVDVACTP